MDEFLDLARVGRITVHESCHIGARTVILPGVEIGPRTIVGANSVVSKSLPPDTVCVGSPARPVSSLEEYLERHKRKAKERPNFPYDLYDIRVITSDGKREMIDAAEDGIVYIVGGRSAELRDGGGTERTSAD